MSLNSDADIKAAAELALENPNCTVFTVANMIRYTLGHQDVRTSMDDAIYALTLVNTTHSIAVLDAFKAYRKQHN